LVPLFESVLFAPTASSAGAPSAKPRVLIAEDNHELAAYIAALIGGFSETRVAHDGERALALARQWSPDLVLADVMMPGRDGLSLCRELKSAEATAKLKVILLTAVTHRDALLQGWEAGADDYLFKPFHPKELAARVKSVLTAAMERKRADATMRQMHAHLERLVEERTTELEQANGALRETDRRKDEFLAMLAHELRNPLAPIANALQVLRQPSSREEDHQWAKNVIHRQTAHLTRLIEDLLDVSRISRGKLELRRGQVRLSEVIDGAIESSRPFIQQREHDLTVSLPPEAVLLDADVTRLSQVFMNLLINAAKYTPPGGRIWLTAQREDADLVLIVKDTGIGIPADKLPRLFEPFYQVDNSLERSHGGLGIGLALARRVVELHGGTLLARSEGEHRGSEFVARLPLRPSLPECTPIAIETNRDSRSTAPLRILVADDNHDAADSLAVMLRLEGHDVRAAYDGAEALAVAQSFPADVMVLDVGMPKVNGYEAAARVRQQPWGRDVVLIALTGWGQDDDKRRSREAGFDHHLVKPVDLAELHALLTLRCPRSDHPSSAAK
jgi:signal transduction histidine kinase